MKKRNGRQLFSWALVALAGSVALGCGAKSATGGNSGTGGGAGLGGNAGTAAAGTGGKAGTGGTAGTGTAGTGTAGTGTAGTGTAGTGGTAGTTAGTGGTVAPATCDASKKLPDGVCKAKVDGVYALKLELDVWWRDEVNTKNNAGELTDPGRGKMNIYFRGTISDVDDCGNGKAIMHPCGTELPPFVASASCAAIQIQFPDDLWDKSQVPDYMTTGHTSGFGVGDILTVDKTMGFLGLSLNAGDAFPDYTKTATISCAAGTGKMWANGAAPALADAPCFPDQDGDGNPGITVNFKNDMSKIQGPGYGCNGLNPTDLTQKFTFNGAPLSLLSVLPSPTTGAKQGWIGLQTELGGAGKIKDGCASGVGDATSGAGLPSRVLHCIQNGGAQCAQSDALFLDQNTPNYHILQKDEAPPAEWKFAGTLNTAKDAILDHSRSLGPRSSVIRLGDAGSAATCATIRSTQFLPFQ